MNIGDKVVCVLSGVCGVIVKIYTLLPAHHKLWLEQETAGYIMPHTIHGGNRNEGVHREDGNFKKPWV